MSSCRRNCSCSRCNPCYIPWPQGPQGPQGPPGPGGALAYGSRYDTTGTRIPITPVTPPTLGQKIVINTNGPLLGTTPIGTTDLQVNTGGVYEISMDLTASLISTTLDIAPVSSVQFRLYINDTVSVPESHFESSVTVSTTQARPDFSQVETVNTIGKTIQYRLNANDRLSIRVESAFGSGSYRYPSLTVTKIAN